MARAKQWSEGADRTICQMRADGATWADIGRRLRMSRNTVIERGRRLRASAPARRGAPKPEVEPLEDPNREPLCAGHPRTWGLLSDAPYPIGDTP